MSQMDELESGVASTSIEGVDAPAVTIEAPSGMTESMVEPAEIPPASLFEWGRGPFARSSDRGIRLVWRAPTYTRPGQQPKRPFPPRVCELCRDPHAHTTRSSYNKHLKKAHGEVGAFYSAELDCLIFRKKAEGQARPQGGQAG